MRVRGFLIDVGVTSCKGFDMDFFLRLAGALELVL